MCLPRAKLRRRQNKQSFSLWMMARIFHSASSSSLSFTALRHWVRKVLLVMPFPMFLEVIAFCFADFERNCNSSTDKNKGFFIRRCLAVRFKLPRFLIFPACHLSSKQYTWHCWIHNDASGENRMRLDLIRRHFFSACRIYCSPSRLSWLSFAKIISLPSCKFATLIMRSRSQ